MWLVFQSKYLGTNVSFLILNSYQLLPKLTVFFLCQVGILCFFCMTSAPYPVISVQVVVGKHLCPWSMGG